CAETGLSSVGGEDWTEDADIDGIRGSRTGIEQHHTDAPVLPESGVRVHNRLIRCGTHQCIISIGEQMSHLCPVICMCRYLIVIENVVVENLVIDIESSALN